MSIVKALPPLQSPSGVLETTTDDTVSISPLGVSKSHKSHPHPKRTIEDIRNENKKFRDVLPHLRQEVNRLVEQKTRPGRRKMIVERAVREKPLYQTVMVFRPLS